MGPLKNMITKSGLTPFTVIKCIVIWLGSKNMLPHRIAPRRSTTVLMWPALWKRTLWMMPVLEWLLFSSSSSFQRSSQERLPKMVICYKKINLHSSFEEYTSCVVSQLKSFESKLNWTLNNEFVDKMTLSFNKLTKIDKKIVKGSFK